MDHKLYQFNGLSIIFEVFIKYLTNLTQHSPQSGVIWQQIYQYLNEFLISDIPPQFLNIWSCWIQPLNMGILYHICNYLLFQDWLLKFPQLRFQTPIVLNLSSFHFMPILLLSIRNKFNIQQQSEELYCRTNQECYGSLKYVGNHLE